MNEGSRQKIGDITGSKNVKLRQVSAQEYSEQELGNVLNSEDVDFEQLLKDVSDDTTDESLATLTEGLEALSAILSELQEIKLSSSDINSKISQALTSLKETNQPTLSKLKIAIPLLPTILSLESEFNLSSKNVSRSAKEAYVRLINLADKFSNFFRK